jgi:hypothetical protein
MPALKNARDQVPYDVHTLNLMAGTNSRFRVAPQREEREFAVQELAASTGAVRSATTVYTDTTADVYIRYQLRPELLSSAV